MNDFFRDLRQLRFPREFRIGSPPFSDQLVSMLDELIKVTRGGPSFNATSKAAPDDESRAESSMTNSQLRFLLDVCTNYWRLRNMMSRHEDGSPREEFQSVFRYVESMGDAFLSEGLRIVDHTGEIFPENGSYSLKTLAFQPTAGITRETIIETIKPTIYYKDKVIQMGEVIVGVPDIQKQNSGETT